MQLSLDAAHALALGALARAGVVPKNAEFVAKALVAAEADGLASHGLSRVPAYADQSLAGKVDGKAVPEVRKTASGAVMVDARDGFAFPAIAAGLARAEALVKDAGIVAVGVTNSHHSGVVGYHIEPLAQRGLVALALGNSPAGIAPWGGARRCSGPTRSPSRARARAGRRW
jgi:(2R)-3-sulfolactate dehydrogenase (NADP+)